MFEVSVGETLLEALVRTLDLGVNVEPGHVTELTLKLKYRYGYGATSG